MTSRKLSRRRNALLASAIAGVVAAATATLPASAAGWTAVNVVGPTGLSGAAETWDATPVDFDRDGDEDVWIGYHDQGGKLWRNDGNGTYTRAAASAWPRVNSDRKIPDRHYCAWADVDRDGRLDSYCGVGRGGANAVKTGKDNELWLQSAPGQFTDVGTQWGLGDVCGRSHYVAFLDANGDVYPDLFVGNAPPRQVAGDPCDNPANGLPNEESKLFLNQGGTGFGYARGMGISGNGGARCAEVTDINGDGWEDLMVCGPPGLRLYRNNAGTGFTNVAGQNGLTASYVDADFGDLDDDGDGDLVTAQWGQFAYRLNNGGSFGGSVRIGVPAVGGGRGVSLGDADGDRDVDVYGLISGTPAGTNPNDVIYLNDELTFNPVQVPAAGGLADAAVALDTNGDGHHRFLVLNGAEVSGPIQLIAVGLS